MLFLGCSSESGNATPSETAKKSIIRKIKGITQTDEVHTLIVDNISLQEPLILPEEEVLQNTSRGELLDYVDSITSSFNNWIVDIEKEAKAKVASCDDGDRDNLMLNLPFAVFFRKVCKLLLLWSAMCCPIFESPYDTSSSANVECDFKNVKLSLGDLIPCRVDVFVQNHLEILDGAVKIASKKYLNTTGDSNSDSSPEDFSVEYGSESGRSSDTDESVDSRHDDDMNISSNTCVACANNDSPGGAHKCDKCGRKVHIMAGCSLSIGGEEGYGEKRICISCSKKETGATRKKSKKSSLTIRPLVRPSRKSARRKSIVQSKNTIRGTDSSLMAATKKSSRNQLAKSTCIAGLSNVKTRKSPRTTTQPNGSKDGVSKAGEKKSSSSQSKKLFNKSNNIHTELNHKEKWSKRRKTKKSVYIRPSPHWDLITNINKRVKLGFLRNGNFSKTIHRVKNVAVSVGNTCCFDSIVQVIFTIIFRNSNPTIR